MKISSISVVVLLLVGAFIVSGCSAYDRESIDGGGGSDYLVVKSTPELVIPEHMDAIEVEDLWVVPDIEYRPLAQFFPDGAPRPRPIVGDADPDLVRIQNLGEQGSWMVVYRAPETVWPVVKQWIQDSGLEIRHEDPRIGILFSERILIDDAQPDSPQGLVNQGKQKANIIGGSDWLAVQLENGVVPGSTEVHLRYMNEQTEESITTDAWPERSTSLEIERAVLNNLANYDASGYVTPTVSIEAAKISLKPKAQVIEDEEGFPALALHVNFTRAWATVQKALENADFDVVSQESRDGYFDVEVSEEVLRKKQKNFFMQLIRLGNAGTNEYPSTVRVRIEKAENAEDDMHIVRLENVDEEETLSVEFARELLLILREHAR